MQPPSLATTESTLQLDDSRFSQLTVIANRIQFTGHNIHLWVRHIRVVLWPRELLNYLTEMALMEMDPTYKKWIVEEEVLNTWIIDSMTQDLFNSFVEYVTVKQFGTWP